MSTETQTKVRENLRTKVEREAFDLGVTHFTRNQDFPRDLGTVEGVLDLARTTQRRSRVFRAVGKGIRAAHIDSVEA